MSRHTPSSSVHPPRRAGLPGRARLLGTLVAGLAFALFGSTSGALAQSAAPLTLKFAIANGQGDPSQPAIDAFIDQVATFSKGSIVIDPIYNAGDATAEGGEPGVAGLTERGEADLSLTASRAWDLEGVTSLQALQAPFLITDGALASAVATSDIAKRALDGMTPKAVVGLTMWPEDLRHPFSFVVDKPFVSPADFAGKTILVQPSALSRSMVETLGGIVYTGSDRDLDVAEGRLQGAESGLLQGGSLPGRPTATGDITFYPKFQVIAANKAKFDGLTTEQQGILRAAAAETQRLTIAAHTSEADAAAAWCANGGSIALAGDAGVAAFQAAAQPTFDRIKQDSLGATLITDIQKLKASTSPAPGATVCGTAAIATAPPTDPLAGTWHTDTITEDQIVRAFVAAGGTETEGHAFFSSLGDSAEQYAVLGMRFDNGIFTEFQSGDGRPDVPGYHATYSMTPDGLLTIASTDGGCTGTYRVSISGHELDLRAKDQCAGHDSAYNTTLFSSFPFHKDGL